MLIHPGCCQQKIRSTARDLKEFLFQLMIVQVSRRFHLFPGDISKGTYHTTSLCFAVQVGLAPWPRMPVISRMSLFLRSGDPQQPTPSNLSGDFPASCVRRGVVQPTSIQYLFPPLLFSNKKNMSGVIILPTQTMHD